jgi:Zn-finger nucleic acid-binding protein
MSHVTSHHKDEENRIGVALFTRLDTQGPSSLCPRCSGIFVDPNTCRSLIETSRQSPYRIEHYTTSELKKYAAHGCALCSVLSRASQRDDDENLDSFFDICPTPAMGLRNEIEWTTARNDGYGQPVHRLSFYYFALPGKLWAHMLDR